MHQKLTVGIDLGTTNSGLGVYRDGRVDLLPVPPDGEPLLPSRVGFDEQGEFKVGPDTRSYMHDESMVATEFKRDIGTEKIYQLRHGEFTPVELSAAVLKKLDRLAQGQWDAEIDQAVISVPANFNDPQRQATKDAARIADIEVRQLINEPTAAAVAYGLDNLEKHQKILVFDLGGGTFDVTVLEMMEGVQDVLVSEGEPKLGGKDFDDKILEIALRDTGFRVDDLSPKSRGRLRREAEKCKFKLDDRSVARLRAAGIELPSGERDLDVRIERSEFEDACRGLLNNARSVTERALKQAGLHTTDVNQVLMIGGGSLTPCVQEMVSELFGRDISPMEEPQTAVARGASIYSSYINPQAGEDIEMVTSDVCARTLGVSIINFYGGQIVREVDHLIEKNSKIPKELTKEYSLLHSDQEELRMEVYECPRRQDDPDRFTRVPEEAILVNELEIDDIPVSQSGDPHPVEVHFSYDADSMVNIRAEVAGKRGQLSFRDTGSGLEEHELVSTQNRLDNLFSGASARRALEESSAELSVDHLSNPTLKALLNKAEEAVNGSELEQELEEIKEELKSSRNLSEEKIAEYEDRLTELILES